MVALDLHAASEGQQRHDGGDEDGRGFAAATRTHVAADRLGEEEGRGGVRRVDTDSQAGDVDALGHHAHSDHPLVGGVRKLGDTIRCIRVVGQNDRRRLAGDEAQVASVGACVVLIRGDDETTRIGHRAAHLLQA